MKRRWVLLLAPLSALMWVAVSEASPDQLPTASLRVAPIGGWAEVLVDGVPVGLGPLEVEVVAGVHLLELAESEFHELTRREVVVQPGERLVVWMPRTQKPAWLTPRGFPPGTWLRIDGGPGPLLGNATAVALADGRPHVFEFRHQGRTIRELVLRRCEEPGCVLPGQSRLEVWEQAR